MDSLLQNMHDEFTTNHLFDTTNGMKSYTIVRNNSLINKKFYFYSGTDLIMYATKSFNKYNIWATRYNPTLDEDVEDVEFVDRDCTPVINKSKNDIYLGSLVNYDFVKKYILILKDYLESIYIEYRSNLLDTTFRKIKIIIPNNNLTKSINNKNSTTKKRISDDAKIVLKNKKSNNDFKYIFNKTPVFNRFRQIHTLRFKYTSVNIASVKNFILLDPIFPANIETWNASHENHIMEFGKATSNTYKVSFKKPISIINGFAIALSSFNSL